MTAPLTLPAGVAGESFEIERVDYQTPTGNGRVTSVTAGFPLWRATWSLSSGQRLAGAEAWRAFLRRLRGAQGRFYAGDHMRRWPLSAPTGFDGLIRAGGGAFDGTATSWSVSADRDQITLNGQPGAFEYAVGDYLMFRWTTTGDERRSLHGLVEAATANGSGVVTARVEPPVPSLVPGGAIADLAEPVCIMTLVTGETRLEPRTRAQRIGGTIAAVQDLRP